MFMTSDSDGAIDEKMEAKFVCISNYASQDRLKTMQYKDGVYSKDKLNFIMSGLMDACKISLPPLLVLPLLNPCASRSFLLQQATNTSLLLPHPHPRRHPYVS